MPAGVAESQQGSRPESQLASLQTSSRFGGRHILGSGPPKLRRSRRRWLGSRDRFCRHCLLDASLWGRRFDPELLRLSGLAVLLDLRLGDVLVLGTYHPEDRRRRVFAARNGAKLLRGFLSRLLADRDRRDLRGAAGTPDAESAFDRGAGSVEGLAFHERGQLVGEVLNEGSNVRHGRGTLPAIQVLASARELGFSSGRRTWLGSPGYRAYFGMLHSSRSHGSAMTQDYSVEIGGPEEPDAPAGPARAPERGRYVRSAGLGPPTGAPRTKRTVRRRCCGRRGCNRSGWAH